MDKKNYISPYDSNDVDAIIEKLVEDYIIDDISNEKDYDELETIINNCVKNFNEKIINDDELDEDEDMDYQDLKDNMYQSIKNSVKKNYSKSL
jgi:hypothetical protein